MPTKRFERTPDGRTLLRFPDGSARLVSDSAYAGAASVTAEECRAELVEVAEVRVSRGRAEAAVAAQLSGDLHRDGKKGRRARFAVEMYRREGAARAEAITFNEYCDVTNAAPLPGCAFPDTQPKGAAKTYGRLTSVVVAR